MSTWCLNYSVPGNCGRRINAKGELWQGGPCKNCDRPVREQPPSALNRKHCKTCTCGQEAK
jgi:hypothetical protein